MLHLELPAGAFLGIASLQRGDHLARIGLQQPGLVQIGVIALAHETAIAPEQRQIIGQRRRQRLAPCRIERLKAGACSRKLWRERRRAFQITANSPCGGEAIPQRREIARAAAPDEQPRQRPGDIGAARSRLRSRSRSATSSCSAATLSCRARIAAGSVSGPARRSASNRPPPGVNVRSMVARRLPARSPDRVRVSSRLARVAASIASPEPSAARTGGDSGGREPSCVRST